MPTSTMEASWNSQPGLLANALGSVTFRSAFPHGGQRKRSPSSSACRWLFARSCPCYGKRSVEVEEKFHSPKTSTNSNSEFGEDDNVPSEIHKKQSDVSLGHGVAADDNVPGSLEMELRYPSRIGRRIVTSDIPFTESTGFAFPILLKPVAADEDDDITVPPRESLEVFRPKDVIDTTKFDGWKLPPADSIWRSFAFAGNTRVVADDDMLSDSSSDLFEIESFSTQLTSTGPVTRRRDSLDEILTMDPRRFIENAVGIVQLRQGVGEEPGRPSNVPSECYPPSELSVQWSVTTTEGFERGSVANFSSAASGYGEAVAFAPVQDKNGGGCGRKRGRLLSCRSEKALNVDGSIPLRYPAEVLETYAAVRADRKPPLVRLNSAKLNRTIHSGS